MVNELNNEFGINGVVEFLSGPGGLPQVSVVNSSASALISLYGAQVLSFKPNGEQDLLWVSAESRFVSGRAIRGGIPVCWPWFGDCPSDASKPSHGFARLSEWNVTGVAELGDGSTQISLSLPCSDKTKQEWPHDFMVYISIIVGTKLEVALTTVNIGIEPFCITSALHSYFNISDIENVTVGGLENEPFLDMLTDSERVEYEPAVIGGEIDRAYCEHDGDCLIEDRGLKRTIRISKKGSRSTVVWNPWIDKSRRMADFGNDEYRSMICVETTNTHSDFREIMPGDDHTLSTVISLD